jgi:hypothetical protein
MKRFAQRTPTLTIVAVGLLLSISYAIYLSAKIENIVMGNIYHNGFIAKNNVDSFNAVMKITDPDESNAEVAANGLLTNSSLVEISVYALIESGLSESDAYSKFRTTKQELKSMSQKAKTILHGDQVKVSLISP